MSQQENSPARVVVVVEERERERGEGGGGGERGRAKHVLLIHRKKENDILRFTKKKRVT